MRFLEFLEIFAMIFLLIFGFVVLLKILFGALLDSSRRRFDVYIKDREDIEEFLESARKSAFIEKVIVITDKNNETLRKVMEKYGGFVAEYEKCKR